METIRPRNDKLKDRNVANISPLMRYKKSDFLSMMRRRVLSTEAAGCERCVPNEAKNETLNSDKIKVSGHQTKIDVVRQCPAALLERTKSTDSGR